MQLQNLKLAIVGTRGIPAKYGGFETFAEEISNLLSQNGISVFVYCDKGSYYESKFNGVNLVFSSVTKKRNPIRYYFKGILWGLRNSDVVLVAGTGGAYFYFLNYLFRKTIITNTDGIETARSKWSIFGKIYIAFSELLAIKQSDYIVADSTAIRSYLLSKYPGVDRKIRVIEYGAHLRSKAGTEILTRLHIKQDSYFLIVCRIEPENNVHIIVKAFQEADIEYPLVIIGDVQNSVYSKELYRKYNSNKIRFEGTIYDKEDLANLRMSCKAYIHGHTVGGTNPSLLEAMACGNVVLAHDNVFNREVTDDKQFYFSSAETCRSGIETIVSNSPKESLEYKNFSINRIRDFYRWDMVADKYCELLREI